MRPKRCSRALVERQVARLPAVGPFLEEPHRNRIVEAPRPGAGRIEIPDLADALVVRQVAVPEEHHVGGLAAQLGQDLGPRAMRPIENVHEEEAQPLEDGARGLACVATAEAVHVAGAGGDRRDCAQKGEHLLAADVPAVEDVIDSAESIERLWAHKPVRVRNDTDAHARSILLR